MVRKQVLRAREHSREGLRRKARITYSSNTRQGTKEIFLDITVVGFRYGKTLKDHLVRAK